MPIPDRHLIGQVASDAIASRRATGLLPAVHGGADVDPSISRRCSFEVVSHYRLLEALEPCGPGELYRARDTRTGRTVAIRLLPPAVTADPLARTRLFERAVEMRAVSHPNITTVFDAGTHEYRVFVVFEYHHGQSLRTVMTGHRITVRRALDVSIQMASAVSAAHAAGFIHRGLSPDTVIFTAKDRVKIPSLDWATCVGVAHGADAMRLHHTVAPEELRGETPDASSNIYSVGAILYEMLTGTPPSHDGSFVPNATNPQLPPELDEVVLRAIAPVLASRYQDAATLLADLRRIRARLDARGGPDEDEAAQMRGLVTYGGRARWLAVIAVLILLVWLSWAVG